MKDDGSCIIFIVSLFLIGLLVTLLIYDWDWRCLIAQCVITKP
jgi:hypothetical protein